MSSSTLVMRAAMHDLTCEFSSHMSPCLNFSSYFIFSCYLISIFQSSFGIPSGPGALLLGALLSVSLILRILYIYLFLPFPCRLVFLLIRRG